MTSVLLTAPVAIAQGQPQLSCDYFAPPEDPNLTPQMSCTLRFDAIETAGMDVPVPPSRYSLMMRRAEDHTQQIISTLFAESRPRGVLDLMVLGQNELAVAPLFNLRISEQDWQRNPNIRQWAKYYPEAASLLNLNPPPVASEPEAAPTTPAPTPTAPAQPETPPAAPTLETTPLPLPPVTPMP